MNYRFLFAVPLLVFTISANAGKGGIGAIFGALIGGAVGSAIGKSAGQAMSPEQALVKLVDQMNKQLPMALDRDTRWDTSQAGPGRRLTYNYTIVSARAAEIDSTFFYQAMSSHLRSSVCTKPDMQIFFKHGVTLSYSYRGSDGGYVGKVDISPRDCGIS